MLQVELDELYTYSLLVFALAVCTGTSISAGIPMHPATVN